MHILLDKLELDIKKLDEVGWYHYDYLPKY